MIILRRREWMGLVKMDSYYEIGRGIGGKRIKVGRIKKYRKIEREVVGGMLERSLRRKERGVGSRRIGNVLASLRMRMRMRKRGEVDEKRRKGEVVSESKRRNLVELLRRRRGSREVGGK